jgi:phosphomannomutase
MSTLDENLRQRAQAWIEGDPDPATRAELQALVSAATGSPGNEAAAAEIRARFAGRLRFGTAGLRAALGAGPMRMNRVVVRQAAAGLVRWLGARPPGTERSGRGPAVVIGYDARHLSDVFALDSARVIAARGGRGMLLPGIVPTPLLAFAIRRLGADAGIMCTASHNPASDNGYKVYLGDGAQIIAPTDHEIAEAIAAVAAEGDVAIAPEDHPSVVRLDGLTIEAYIEHVAAQALAPYRVSSPRPSPLSIVYTPLHGVGRDVAVEVLRRAGFPNVDPVVEQADPDPDFPTCAFPNPEEPGALDLALDQARVTDADLVLANDPDADRLGVAVPAEGGWRILTGNEIGALLGEHVLGTTTGPDRLVVTTFVSSRLLHRQAEHHGVHFAEVLTGFKWVVRPGMDNPGRRFVFGYEEALGFSVDAFVRDKDGISAALAFAGLLAALRAEDRTVWDQLEVLSRRHGHHATQSWSVRFDGPEALDRMVKLAGRWRDVAPVAVAGRCVSRVTDMAAGGLLPPTDALVVDLADGGRIVVRPSGTEPKVKFYAEVVVPVADSARGYADARRAGDRALTEIRRGVTDDLDAVS